VKLAILKRPWEYRDQPLLDKCFDSDH